jgi:Cu/Zn superoxide dismutase
MAAPMPATHHAGDMDNIVANAEGVARSTCMSVA